MAETAEIRADCANCGTPLQGEFCWNCGQRAKEPRRIVIGLVQDVIVETMSIDGKLARTVANLFLRPGRLAQEYISGKRVKYSPPFRLYLFTSVIFFFVLFYAISQMTGIDAPPDPNGDAAPEAATMIPNLSTLPGEIRDDVREAVLKSIAENGQLDPDILDGLTVDGELDLDTLQELIDTGQLDAEVVTVPAGAIVSEFGNEGAAIFNVSEEDLEGAPDWLRPTLSRLSYAGGRMEEDPRLFFSQAQENLPRVMLFAPVAYALMLIILYIYRRKFLIYDHLIVSLYMHAALYAYLIFMFGFSFVPVVGTVANVLIFIWGILQPYAVLRQAYGSNWFSVFVKGSIIQLLYVIQLSFLITAGLGLALYNS